MITFMLWGLLITVISFAYRWAGLQYNSPFWVDEFSSAHQSILLTKHGLSAFTNPSLGIDLHNSLSHLLIAGSFGLFGPHEWSARLPFVIIGSMVPAAVFLFTRYVFSLPVALSATLLSMTSYILITWSRQARGYVLQQLLVIISLYLYLRLLKKKSTKTLILFFVTALLGIATHFMFFVLLGTLLLHYFLFKRNEFKTNVIKNKLTYLILPPLTFALYKTGFFTIVNEVVLTNLFRTSNLWYYHSFLWREYGLFIFLGLVGLFIALPKAKRTVSLLLLYIGAQILFVSYFWPPYTSRYLLPIIPLLFIGTAWSINYLCLGFTSQLSRFKKPLQVFLPVAVTLAIIVNGHKFTLKPQIYYSVDHDFREIALIDYSQVYNIIKSKGQLEKGQTAVIDTWHDRLYWYLGQDFPDPYLFRWINEEGLINGLPKLTTYKINAQGEKYIPDSKHLLIVGELKDLKLAMAKYPRGFIFIDDASLPKEVLDYVQTNLKKELYLDHYPLDDNPYSIWPATLYSWGIK
ncbi:glycosyltransferase family 39 protein [Candidatus Woesebacteria bacterium]|nr:glycosyltransferase family 39 protein [Candidatus Woesebacteria bacterium]